MEQSDFDVGKNGSVATPRAHDRRGVEALNSCRTDETWPADDRGREHGSPAGDPNAGASDAEGSAGIKSASMAVEVIRTHLAQVAQELFDIQQCYADSRIAALSQAMNTPDGSTGLDLLAVERMVRHLEVDRDEAHARAARLADENRELQAAGARLEDDLREARRGLEEAERRLRHREVDVQQLRGWWRSAGGSSLPATPTAGDPAAECGADAGGEQCGSPQRSRPSTTGGLYDVRSSPDMAPLRAAAAAAVAGRAPLRPATAAGAQELPAGEQQRCRRKLERHGLKSPQPVGSNYGPRPMSTASQARIQIYSPDCFDVAPGQPFGAGGGNSGISALLRQRSCPSRVAGMARKRS